MFILQIRYTLNNDVILFRWLCLCVYNILFNWIYTEYKLPARALKLKKQLC